MGKRLPKAAPAGILKNGRKSRNILPGGQNDEEKDSGGADLRRADGLFAAGAK